MEVAIHSGAYSIFCLKVQARILSKLTWQCPLLPSSRENHKGSAILSTSVWIIILHLDKEENIFASSAQQLQGKRGRILLVSGTMYYMFGMEGWQWILRFGGCWKMTVSQPGTTYPESQLFGRFRKEDGKFFGSHRVNSRSDSTT